MNGLSGMIRQDNDLDGMERIQLERIRLERIR